MRALPHRPPAPVSDLVGGSWLPVDPRSLASRDGPAEVWALGDAAAMSLPDGRPLPKAAVFARAQALTVAGDVDADGGPQVALELPSAALHAAKETEERLWLRVAD